MYTTVAEQTHLFLSGKPCPVLVLEGFGLLDPVQMGDLLGKSRCDLNYFDCVVLCNAALKEECTE